MVDINININIYVCEFVYVYSLCLPIRRVYRYDCVSLEIAFVVIGAKT
jgi:hypothetical protein